MRWDFWNKDKKEAGVKAVKPKDLTTEMGRKLVVEKKYDPDWVWSLKMITKAKQDKPSRFDYRIFDPVKVKENNIKVTGYSVLDDRPDLVLFDGWYDKDGIGIQINDHCKPKETAA